MVALGIDQGQLWRVANNLTTEDKGSLIGNPSAGPVLLRHTNLADIIGGLIDIHHCIQIDLGLIGDILGHMVDYRLGGGKVASRQNHKLAVSIRPKAKHLGIGIDLVDTRTGARVGTKGDAFINDHGNTISHVCIPSGQVLNQDSSRTGISLDILIQVLPDVFFKGGQRALLRVFILISNIHRVCPYFGKYSSIGIYSTHNNVGIFSTA